MRRVSWFWPILFLGMGLFFINKFTLLEYDVTLMDYLKLSRPLSMQETQYLEKKGSVVYGGNINEPPLGIVDPETGQYFGLVVDYINALSVSLELPIISKPMVWDEALTALANKQTDLCDMIPSTERSRYFDFSSPLYHLKAIVVVPVGRSELVHLSDLNGLKVAAMKGDQAIESLLSVVSSVTLSEVGNLNEALELLKRREVDAVIGDEPVIWYHLKELSARTEYRIMEESLYESPVVIAVPKGESELLALINKAILKLKVNGTLKQINTKWRAYAPLIEAERFTERWQLITAMAFSGLALITSAFYLLSKRLSAIIKDKTETLRFTFDNLDYYVAVLDDDKTIVDVNRALLDYLKADKKSVVGRHYSYIALLQTAVTEQSNQVAFPYNGRYYEIKTKDHKLILIRDITLEKIEQQRLIQTSKMEAIGQLASGVAHELRNPLGTVRNSTYLLNELISDQSISNEENAMIGKKSLNAINKAITRASGIIDNLLNFARLTSGEVVSFDLRLMLDELVDFFQSASKDKQILFILQCDTPFYITTNDNALRHILINLISNACDAIGHIGTIQVYAEKNPETGDFKIRVVDNGRGISPDDQHKIFDPFYTTKKPGEGTGLGLYIVYTEIQNLGGTIDLSSQLNEGTTFTLSFTGGKNDA